MHNFCPWVLGNPYFESPQKIAGNKLQDVSFHNHLMARYNIENWWRGTDLNNVCEMGVWGRVWGTSGSRSPIAKYLPVGVH